MLHAYPNANYYKSTLNENVVKKSYDFLQTIIKDFNHKTWDCNIKTSYNITNNILNYPELHSLKMNVLGHIDNFMRLRNTLFYGYIDDSWVNVYEKDFYQEPHVHTSPVNRFISGVLYLTEVNSPIWFEPLFIPFNRFNIVPDLGDILLFNDDLPHSVAKNEKDGLRVSLAFNFKLCERAK